MELQPSVYSVWIFSGLALDTKKTARVLPNVRFHSPRVTGMLDHNPFPCKRCLFKDRVFKMSSLAIDTSLILI